MVGSIKPPPGIAANEQPDDFTRIDPDFSKDSRANNRVFHVDLTWFHYGTADKGHAAALILSFLLLLSAVLIVLFGVVQLVFGTEAKWLEVVLTWIGNAFLFTSGIAVGQGRSDKHE